MKTSIDKSLGQSILWVGGYFCVMLLYTGINMGIWRKVGNSYSNWLNLVTMILLSIVFIKPLTIKTSYRLRIFDNLTVMGILYAIMCAALFYFLLDKCLDPFFESLFPASEEAYQDSIRALSKSPITTFIHVCILAPVIEEILMRGFVLGGLQSTLGVVFALLVSAFLFALLHFNMVQTLSAFICSLILGMLYLKTGSILCCMIAHCGYNAISYFATIAIFM
jgi:membrane protease YdiL (CAAX protease family)